MTPQEKAQDLIEQFMEHTVEWNKIKEIAFDSKFHAKQCALIAVNEMLNENSIREGNNDEIITYEPYWLKVKQEIEKL